MIPISPKEAATPCDDDDGPDPNFEKNLDLDPFLPRYSAKDIIVEHTHKLGHLVKNVRVGTQRMLCKSNRRGLEFDDLKQEIINLQNIAKAFADFDIPPRIPLLRGFVVHPVSGAIIGMLRTWIPPSPYGGTLEVAARHMLTISPDIRRRWLKQITETIDQLHKAGLVWGDGKAANVCIDHDNNAWLIDFAGGWTNFWVSKDITGTKEGDKHALLKLKAFMFIKCPEITKEELNKLYWGVGLSSSDSSE